MLTQLRLIVVACLTIGCAASVFAQNGSTPAVDTFSGKYEGTAKTADGTTVQVMVELKNDGGKVSGNATAPQTTVAISEGTLSDGKLTIKFVGHSGTLTAKVEGEKINGEWIEGDSKRTVELKKVVTPPNAAASINLNGDWEAVADAEGQPFPFALTLKIDGEKVTGGSSSQLGESTITSGSWKDGVLTFQLDGQNGTVMMNAKVVDGKLTGEFDYAGQIQGRWVAVKKK